MAVSTSPNGSRSWGQGTSHRLWLLLAIAALALFTAYAGSYYRLSRRGLREAKLYNMKGFLYTPTKEVFATQDLSRHYSCAQLYAPLNCIDQALFGTDGPVRGITWGLSK